VEVNLAGTLTTTDFTADGKISQTTGHEIGDLVVRFQYDALGRLIMAQRIHSGGPPAPVYRTEHYYYDGVRRIQTTDDMGTVSTADDQTRHEYVYGPGYVDEFVLQSYRDTGGVQQPLYMLQDANFNVMALLNQAGEVLEQYQWEPYGLPAIVEVGASPRPDNSLGHQGLFFYAFEGGTAFPASPSLPARGLYFNRNRWYSPHLGRFMSADPRGTSMPGFAQPCPQSAFGAGCDCEVARVEECQGCGCGGGADCSDTGIIEPCEAGPCFDDGMNLYQYVQSNPVMKMDPKGTSGLLATVISVAIGADTDARHNRGVAVRGGIIAGFLTYWLYLHLDNIDALIRDIILARTMAGLIGPFDREQCGRLYEWCREGGGWDCFNGMLHCRRTRQWDTRKWPLPSNYDPDTPPPGW